MHMKLPRRRALCVAAAAVFCPPPPLPALATPTPSPLLTIQSAAVAYKEQQQQQRKEALLEAEASAYNVRAAEQELELESMLEESLSASPRQTAKLDSIIATLESTRGRQQRAGWGQSDDRYDLPFIGGWDVVYYSSTEKGKAATITNAPDDLELVSARQWIYGPGSGGAAFECVYRALPDGPRTGSLLLTRVGDVTKMADAAVRLAFSERSRRYQLLYTATEVKRLQRADGQWARVTTTTPTSKPSVGALLAEEVPQPALCAPSAGLLNTTYLSDVLWIVRTASGSAAVLRRTAEEAMKPQNGDGPDGFDAMRFGPSGRKLWMFDTGYDDREAAYQRGRRRVRTDAEISAS